MVNRKISFIGTGRVGNSLACGLNEAGFYIHGCYDIEKNKTSGLSGVISGITVFSELENLVRESDIIFITTVDDQIETVANTIASGRNSLTGKVFIHTSGLHSSKILSSITRMNAHAGSMHPCVSIIGIRDFSGVHFMLEGDEQAVKWSKDIVSALQGTPMMIHASLKPLYHLCAVIVSNVTVGLFHEVVNIIGANGYESSEAQSVFLPLLKSTLKNLEATDSGAALTGPIVRGDRDTIAVHLKQLANVDDDLALIIKLLYTRMVKMARETGSISKSKASELNDLILSK